MKGIYKGFKYISQIFGNGFMCLSLTLSLTQTHTYPHVCISVFFGGDVARITEDYMADQDR